MTKSPTKTPRTKPAGKVSVQPSTCRTASSGNPSLPDEAVETATTGRISKLALLMDLLNRQEGASITELAEATSWQPHSVRGAMSGALKRKGLTVTSGVIDGVRRYRIGSPE